MRLVCPAIDEFGVQGVLGLVPAHWWVELCFCSWVSSCRALGAPELVSVHCWVGPVPDMAGCGILDVPKGASTHCSVGIDCRDAG